MKTFICDTNLILRYMTNDDEEQSKIAADVMDKVDNGLLNLILPDVVIMELCWTLKSLYRLTRKDIAEKLVFLCSCEGVSASKEIIEALDEYGNNNVDLADAILGVKSRLEKIPVVTWNKKVFNKLGCEFYHQL
ncbi:putative nucleic-acid-binding protein [Paenibacillus mucilaginosus]|uniref:PIN domain-containing protein n=1 Tax=Paenibacillus mucilaginosus TaxID=61624 RepID=UPI003D237A24